VWRGKMCQSIRTSEGAVLGRSYEQDVEDVRALQAGDGAALERLLDEYSGNLKAAATKMQHALGFEDAYQEAVSAFLAWVSEMQLEKARFIRRDVGFEVQHRLQEAAYPGMNYKSVQRARSVLSDLRVEAWEDTSEARPSVDSVVSVDYSGSQLSKESALNLLALHRQVSLDSVLDDSFDDADPFDVEGSTGFGSRLAADVDEFVQSTDAEFADRLSIADVEAQATPVQSVTAAGKSGLESMLSLLTKKQRAAVELWLRYPDWSLTDIATDAGMDRRTFGRVLQRAFESLKANVPGESLVDVAGDYYVERKSDA